MSTWTFSPLVMNNGTWISKPVSSRAGLVPPLDRSPCSPGSVYSTVSSTDAGSSTNSGVLSCIDTITSWLSSRKCDASPTMS